MAWRRKATTAQPLTRTGLRIWQPGSYSPVCLPVGQDVVAAGDNRELHER